MKKIFVLILTVALWVPAVPALANCGSCPGDKAASGGSCTMAKGSDSAATLNEAAQALEASNPELAAKVRAIASDCSANLADGDKA